MKQIVIIVLVSIVLFISACATVTKSSPNQYQNYKIFQEPFDTVWSKLLLYRSGSTVPVSVIDKDSGILQTTDSASFSFNQWGVLDNKYVVVPNTFLNTWVYMKLNTMYLVQVVDTSSTKVTIKVNYQLYDSNIYKTWVQAQSSGYRESEILNELETYLKK